MHKELLHVGADTEPFSLKAQNNVGHGRYLYETVGGSGQRLVSNLVGEGTQCKPLKVDSPSTVFFVLSALGPKPT